MAKQNKDKALKDFAARLDRVMKRKMITIDALAAGIGLSYEMTRRYVSGLNLPRDRGRLNAIAQVLGVDPVWLLEGKIEEFETPRVPMVRISDGDIRQAARNPEWIPAPEGFLDGIAIKMTMVLGDGFQLGDIVFVKMSSGQLPADGARVLLEVLKPAKGSPKYIFRRAHYGPDLAVEYRAEVPGAESTFTVKTAKVFGVAEFLLTKLAKY